MTSTPPDDPLLFQFFIEIGIIEQLARALFERGLPHGLTLAQFRILNHFTRLGGERSPVELARSFQVTKAAITNALHKLDAKGFVHIKPDPNDGRGKRVSLSDEGRAAREDAITTIGPILPLLLAEIPEQEFENALPLLRRLRVFLDENRDIPVAPPRKP